MTKVDRVLTLLRLLSQCQHLTAAQLARMSDISERGIYRYLRNLREAGVDIQHGVMGYYIRKPRSQAVTPEYLQMVRQVLEIGLAHCTSKAMAKAGRQEMASIDAALQSVCSRHTLVIGHAIKPSALVPLETHDTIAMDIMPLVYSSLVRVDSTGDASPCLATTWKQEGSQWHFTLRKDAQFANGENVEPKHIVNTYKQAMECPATRDRCATIDQISAQGNAVIFHTTKTPSRYTFALPISNGSASGPYLVKQWGDVIVLEASKTYFGTVPYKKLIFKYFETPAETLQAIADGEIDIALDLVANDVLSITNRRFHIYPVQDGKYYTLFFSVQRVDKQTRIALRKMFDKKAILKTQLKGKGELCNGPFRPGAEESDKTIPLGDYDRESGVKRLGLLGWMTKDCWLEKDGRRLTLKLGLLEQTDVVRRISIAVKAQLGVAGVDVVVTDGECDMMLGQCCYGPGPMHCRAVWQSASADNVSNYRNNRVDLLFASADKAEKDQRARILQEVHQQIYRDCPAIFIATSTTYVGSSTLIPESVQSVSDLFALFRKPGKAVRKRPKINLAAVI